VIVTTVTCRDICKFLSRATSVTPPYGCHELSRSVVCAVGRERPPRVTRASGRSHVSVGICRAPSRHSALLAAKMVLLKVREATRCSMGDGTKMPRLRKRVCLEDGLRLDLNQLIRDGIIVPGAVTGRTTFWQVVGSCELVDVAVVTADLTDLACLQVRIRMRGLDQTIDLIAQRRPSEACRFTSDAPF
jgi:hypothetical protein